MLSKYRTCLPILIPTLPVRWRIFIIFLIFGVPYGLRAQTGGNNSRVQDLITRSDEDRRSHPRETVYLSFDKPNYAIGDTIWFKAFLLDGSRTTPGIMSDRLYVELINDSGRVAETQLVALHNGTAAGDIILTPDHQEGNYTLRAYTNWMRNFEPSFFFRHYFYFIKPGAGTWLLAESQRTDINGSGRTTHAELQLKDLSGRPVVGQALLLRSLYGKKEFGKQELATDIKGIARADVAIPPNTDLRQISLALSAKADIGQKLVFPFYPVTASDIDLQFMPEGGDLVAGLYNRIAFKSIGEDGLGIDVEGKVADHNGNDVAVLKSFHQGMGYFSMIPVAGEHYQARLTTKDGTERSYPLPPVKASGLVLRVENTVDPDTIRVYISGTPDRSGSGNSYDILMQMNDHTYLGASFGLTNSCFNTKVPARLFPTGILNILVVDPDKRVMGQRKVFIDHHDRLDIRLAANNTAYPPRDSAGFTLEVKNAAGNPVTGNFSVTVTDDALVTADPRSPHIESYFLLSSEIKGLIQDPDQYFGPAPRATKKALDVLLLTQGWTGSAGEKSTAADTSAFLYKAEQGNEVNGTLRGMFNKPAANKSVTLMSLAKEPFIAETTTNAEGRFAFTDLPMIDTPIYTLKAHSLKGAEVAVDITVDKFQNAPVTSLDHQRLAPWNVNATAVAWNYLQNIKRQIEQGSPANSSGTLLKEVVIKGRTPLKLKGLKGEDIYYYDANFTEKDLIRDDKLTLMSYLEKYLKGFRTGQYHASGENFFLVKNNIVQDIVIDGQAISDFYSEGKGKDDFYEYQRSYLDYIEASSVTQLVVYHKYLSRYRDWFAILVIKTRGGSGVGTRNAHGQYVYRAMPFHAPRAFYHPRYEARTSAYRPDTRSTIYWAPDVALDAAGKGKICFFTADKSSTYTLTVEGTDLQGHFGIFTQKIKVTADGRP